MKNTLSLTTVTSAPALRGALAAEQFGNAPTVTLQGSGLPFAVSGGSYAPGMHAHFSTLGGIRKDADGVPPRGRPV